MRVQHGHGLADVITVRCARCGGKVFRYDKAGKGRLLHCWRSRIVKDYSVRAAAEVRCECGNLIGIDEGKWVKMKPHSFVCTGAISRG